MRRPDPAGIYRWLFWDEEWNIGIINEPMSVFLDKEARPKIEWLPPLGKGQYLADPFAIVKDQRSYIFCEQFDYRTYKGRIVRLEIRNGRISSVTPTFDLSIHASYPYLVEENGEVYCIPETYQAGEISLYKAEKFPDIWKKVSIMISRFPGVDSTVFRYDDRWWLASVENTRPLHTKLFVWCAKELRGPWVPHSGNPVKCDISSSRPAGSPFVYDGYLYRPAQDCSRTYGGRIVLNRVLRLTREEFEEEKATVIEPDPNGPYPAGLHTISRFGNMTIVDGKRFRLMTESPLNAGVTRRIRDVRKSLVSDLTGKD